MNIDERIAQNLQKYEQLRNQKKAKESREKEVQRKMGDRRKFIVGGLIIKFFPEVMRFQPRRNNNDTALEFAPLENFLSGLAADKRFLERLKSEITKPE